MPVRSWLLAAALLCTISGSAFAQPKTISLWHPFTLETDMIYGGIRAFNGSQNEYRIDPRIVPAPQMDTELIKAIASGSVPDLFTLDNPVVASFSARGVLTDLTDRVAKSSVVLPQS